MKLTLRAARVNLGLSIDEAAERIGVSRDTLRNYESRRTFPDVPAIKKIEKAYNLEYKDINFFDD